jgi:hypothetical protein
MENFKINSRRAALLFVAWALVSIIFAGISYAAAIGENNKEFGLVSALRLNLVQFYLWAILSPVVMRAMRSKLSILVYVRDRLLPQIVAAKAKL